MRKIRKWIRFFFGFSRSETNGFLLLLPLLFIILFSAPVYRALRPPAEISSTALVLYSRADTLISPQNQPQKEVRKIVQLFSFDPNTVSHTQLLTLGFTEKVSTRIVKFRSKGGKFRIKTDLLKVYGMDSLHFRQLKSYILLPDQFVREKYAAQKTVPRKAERPTFDLNQADTARLKLIHGIGSKLAWRIVTYRTKLGGCIRLDQLREIYGLDTAVISKITKEAFVAENCMPVKININQATDKELSAHPYISIMIAKAIVTYRFQHGNFSSIEDIRNLRSIKKEEADRMMPYITVE